MLICIKQFMWRCVFVLLLFMGDLCIAQKKWDGGANSSAWEDPLNWNPDGVPGTQDEVILDHQWLRHNYLVRLPAGNSTVEILSLAIAPLDWQITLILPASNTAFSALKLTSSGDAIVINNKGVLINASAAASGNPIQLNGKLRINDGGKYIHQTVRGNAELIDKLNIDAGTENGIFEFDVPGTAGYTVSLTGNRFGTLVLSAKAAGGIKSYSGSGTSDLTIFGDLIIQAGASLTSTLTADILLGGDLVTDGKLSLHPVTVGTKGRSLVFSGKNVSFRGSGNFSTNAFFRNLLVSKTSALTLYRSATLPFTPNAFICQGTLVCGQQILSGPGSFMLADSARIIMGADSGITRTSAAGNIQTTFRSMSNKAHYVFSGTVNQFSGDGIPDTVASLTVDNPRHLILSKSVSVTDSLHLVVGKIIADSTRFLRLISGRIKGPPGGPADPGWAEAFIDGPLLYHMADTTMHFLPTGAGDLFAPLQVKQTDMEARVIQVSFEGGPNNLNLAPSLTAISTRGYWSFSADRPGSWLFALSHRPTDTGLYSGMSPLPAVLVNLNGKLKWSALAGRNYPANGQFSWLYTDTAVQGLTGLTTAYSAAAILLPLRLIDLRSENTGGGIKIIWKADQDNHPAIYRIERSRDGRTFSPLGEVRAGSSGLSQHSWQDDHPLEPYNYYRLFMEGQGAGKFSNIIRQSYSRPRALFYPNPVIDQIHIFFPDRSSRSYIEIVNSTGVVLRTHLVKATNCVIGVGDLPTGAYILRFRGTKNPINLQFTKY
jgi:hypothetical protein